MAALVYGKGLQKCVYSANGIRDYLHHFMATKGNKYFVFTLNSKSF